ncbi:MAG: MFS transporter [Candidatus Omnitrophica bacterium]|nr:MFS transporter [Candidatus Omnitrophota bacterium]
MRSLNKRQLGCFVLAGINAFATSFYFNYLFFLMHSRFGFGNASNLGLAALNGFVYMFGAWFGGRLGQRSGYFRALRLGFAVMALSLAAGTQVRTQAGHCLIMVVWSIGMCFTWPPLEALISENHAAAGLSRMLGIYNVVWASGSAVAYFCGGLLIHYLGMASLFWLPAALHLLQLFLLERIAIYEPPEAIAGPLPVSTSAPQWSQKGRTSPKAFMRMAWAANPFAYMAINTVIALIPTLASRLGLSITWAGILCSIWFFARLLAFVGLWWWPGWHYRVRWLFASYALLIASFLLLLLVPLLWLLILTQILFGLAVGLIYYSSLFYSMDVGETKGDYGGVHESAVGAGIFAGPAVGAAAICLFPDSAYAGAWAVSALLLMGGTLIGTIRIAHRHGPELHSPLSSTGNPPTAFTRL